MVFVMINPYCRVVDIVKTEKEKEEREKAGWILLNRSVAS